MTAAWEKLNRYVDGELDARAAALVAAEIARDPDLARRVATLHQLKSVASTIKVDMFDAPPADFIHSEPTGLPYRWKFGAIAASLAVLLATAVTMTTMQYAGAPSAAPEFVQAFAAHQAWLAQPAVATPNVNVARAPDLSAAGLKLVFWHQAAVSQARQNVMFGYLGPRGCKLGLWIGPLSTANASPAGPSAVPAVGDISSRAWSHADRLYVVLAKGMDSGRLDQLAKLIFKSVTQPSAPPAGVVVAHSTSESPPCRA